MFQFLKTQGQKITKALSKTREAFTSKLQSILSKPLNQETLEELEQFLYEADLGSEVIENLLQHIQQTTQKQKDMTTDDLILSCYGFCKDLLPKEPIDLNVATKGPTITILLGTNGTGKTTSLAKLAHYYQKQGKKVLVAAADTYRAAATEQLLSWAAYLGVTTVTGSDRSDPATILFNAITKARESQHDVILCDTAGRVDSQIDFLHQLDKMYRVAQKLDPSAPHNTLFTVDATLGQNISEQITTFQKYMPISGLIVTKLDGTAKGGALIPLYQRLQIPIHFVGTGEKLDDFSPFDSTTYLESMFKI